MSTRLFLLFGLLATVPALAQESGDEAVSNAAAADTEAIGGDEAAADAGLSPDQPKAMSGMSILGNEEAPKSLVIVPWKSSRMGSELSLTDTLDDRARPVDRDVFLRELRYYDIRSGTEPGSR